jgi:hypothetical protein
MRKPDPGSPSYKGKGNPDGSATFDVQGDHKLS